ncbi:MAG: hypothetical protein ABFD54_14745 [Armatimonadota bacterium]|nr:hypothetical protein [bacterium]
MARGRFISKCIVGDKAISDLSSDTSRLAFTWLIVHADCEGRVFGDPAMVASMLFPRRRDITPKKMARFIDEWAEHGLVVRYQVEDDTFLELPSFKKHQQGLRPDREAASIVPPNPNNPEASIWANSEPTPEEDGNSSSISISQGQPKGEAKGEVKGEVSSISIKSNDRNDFDPDADFAIALIEQFRRLNPGVTPCSSDWEHARGMARADKFDLRIALREMEAVQERATKCNPSFHASSLLYYVDSVGRALGYKIGP